MQDNMKYRQSLVAIGGSLVGRWRTTTASNQGVAMRQPAHAWLGRLLLGGLVTLALSAVAIANAEDKIIHVNCDDGKTIKQALHKADPGETIRVTGTCTERVTITTDRTRSTDRGQPFSTVEAATRSSSRAWSRSMASEG
jgi:hypothetical protein